ncbi:MAG TPA: hypothetical protein VGK73_19495, partial [Polyangiaceae bacterium]
MPSPRSLDLSQFVGAALRLRRELWHAVSSTGGPVEQGFLPISREALRTWKEKLETDLAPYGNPDVLEQLGLLVDGGRRARVSLLETHALLRAFLCHGSRFSKEVNLEKLRADVMYLLYRDLRATYGISGLSEVASVFRTLCKLLDQTNDVRSFHQEQRQAHGQHLDLFLDVAFSLEELEHGPPATDFRVRQEWLDPNFLVSRLFGFRTAITGFDVLFDGGVSLTDSGPGRVILIRGPFGSGKSILSLGLAAEVVRKGGFAAVIPLDDTTSAIESYLASFGLLEGLKPLSSRKERFDAVLVGGRLEVLHRRELRTSRAALFSELQKQA